MPALIPLSAEERRQWLKDYEYTYLERDVADLARLDKRWRGGLIIYPGNEIKHIANPQIWAVPSHRLFTSR